MKKKTNNLGGKKVENKTVDKKKKTAIICSIVGLFMIGIIILGLALGGVFEKEEAILYKRNVGTKGFYKYYIEGENYPGKYAVMTFEDEENQYEIEVYLMSELAPVSVNNFIKYAKDGFYDGTVIHRIVKGTSTFQGGGYTYNSTGNKYESKTATYSPIAGEFAENNNGNYKYNNISHFAGSISMARTNSYDSATSQWFISYDDYSGWDGKYACFGFIVDGEDVQKIKEIATKASLDSNDYPIKPITLKSVKIIEK